MDKSTINILIALAAVTLTLGGTIYGAFASLRDEMRSVRVEMHNERVEMRKEIGEFRGELRGEIQAFRAEVNVRFTALETRLTALEQNQARLFGYREGFAEAVGISAASKE